MKRYAEVLFCLSCILIVYSFACFTCYDGVAETRTDPYESFVLNGDFKTYGQEYIDDNAVSLILYYESKQNEPMLIISNGASSTEKLDYYVFFVDHEKSINYFCTLNGPVHSIYYYPDQKQYTGFFCSRIVNNDYDTMYFSFDGSQVNTTEVSSLFLNDYNGQIDRITEDEQLYKLSISAPGRKEIPFYPKSSLIDSSLNGWLDLQALSPGYSREISDSYLPISTPHATIVPTPTPTETIDNPNSADVTGISWGISVEPTKNTLSSLTSVPTTYHPTLDAWYATATPYVENIGDNASFPINAYTNMEKANVRDAANGEKITRIEERGTAITVLGETADTNGTHWYSVRLSNGVEGYIRADLVSFTFDPSWQTTPVPIVSSSPSSYLAKTTTKKVNARTRADGESKTVTQIKDAGTVVTVTGEEYSANGVLWYAVNLADGRSGYIRGDLLERVNGNASATIRSLIDKDRDDFRTYDVAFFHSRDCDAYSGPGTQYLRGANGKAYMSTNDSIYVYGRENGWILVQYSISKDHWRIAYIRDDAVASGSIPALSFEYRQVATVQKSVITDDPLYSQSALTTVNAGENILYLARLDQWAYIEYKNVRGFIPLTAI